MKYEFGLLPKIYPYSDLLHDLANKETSLKLQGTKVIMQGKLIAVSYTLRTYWNQFSLAEFVNKNRLISVRLVFRRLKALNFDYFDNSHNFFLWPEYFIDFLCERWIPCYASTSVLCLHYHPETVDCSTKDAYTK